MILQVASIVGPNIGRFDLFIGLHAESQFLLISGLADLFVGMFDECSVSWPEWRGCGGRKWLKFFWDVHVFIAMLDDLVSGQHMFLPEHIPDLLLKLSVNIIGKGGGSENLETNHCKI